MALLSIGYGNRSSDEFVDLLKDFDISYLVDVRTKPYSKYNVDFQQGALKSILRNNKIRYVFMGDTLGGLPDDLSCYSDGKVDYKKTAKTPFFLEGIERLKKANNLDSNIAIMCSESKPEQCHRSKLIGEELKSINIFLNHIDETGQLIDQDEVIRRLTKGQYSMFEDAFTSVKNYEK